MEEQPENMNEVNLDENEKCHTMEATSNENKANAECMEDPQPVQLETLIEVHKKSWEQESSSAVTDDPLLHAACLSSQQNLRADYELRLEQLSILLNQKENSIVLLQREHKLMEKEKQTYCREMELARKEKETTVIKFAMQEKLVIDSKKEKDLLEKQLLDIKRKAESNANLYQLALNEKARLASLVDRKCDEMQKQLRENEQLKIEYNYLNSKFKYTTNKLNLEMEANSNLKKKLEEHLNKMEEKSNENVKMEFAAKSILLTHEMDRKNESINNLMQDLKRATESEQQLKEQLNKTTDENVKIVSELQQLQREHETVQSAYSDELLSAAKLRSQLEELQLLKTQVMLNDEKIDELEQARTSSMEKLEDSENCIKMLQGKHQELLDFNKEMSESLTSLQNDNSLLRSKVQGIETENDILRKEKLKDLMKQKELENKLKTEENSKNHDRQLLARHLSEKTKLYEVTKIKLDDVMGQFQASINKHNTIIKELKRELQKDKRLHEREIYKSNCSISDSLETNDVQKASPFLTKERHDSTCEKHSSDSADIESIKSDVMSITENTLRQNEIKGVTSNHLIDRILRLQQLVARQAEKIDFLENHTLSLVTELQKKSRIVQYYMLRYQGGTLTSTKSIQNNADRSGAEIDMKNELSLEINQKLQAALEDTLLKNITLKENVDVLGVEVDNLTQKLRTLEEKYI